MLSYAPRSEVRAGFLKIKWRMNEMNQTKNVVSWEHAWLEPFWVSRRVSRAPQPRGTDRLSLSSANYAPGRSE